MRLKSLILVLFLQPWMQTALHSQGIRITQGSYINVRNGSFIHEPKNLVTGDHCGLHSHSSVKIHGKLVNEDNSPACIDTGIFIMEGSQPQSILGKFTVDSLVIDNPSYISFSNDICINKKFKLITGRIILGNGNLTLSSDAVITGAFSAAAMIVPTGNGAFRKSFSTVGNFTFPVGDTSGIAEYSPVTVTLSNGTFGNGNWVGVNLSNSKYPDPNIQDHYLKRYWNLSTNNIVNFTADLQFQYLTADVVGTESKLYSLRASPQPNTAYLPADSINHRLSITGIDGLGSFTGATAPCYNLQVIASVVSNVICYGGSNGSAVANVSGASGTVSYLWSSIPPQITQTAVNLPAGTYTVTVTDGFNCTKQTSVTISQPAQWWPSLAGPSTVCENTSGNVYSTDAGMSGYQWSVSSGGIINSGIGTNTVTVTWTSAGPQSVSVNYTTPLGCSAVSPAVQNVTVNPRPAPLISGPSSTCQATSGLIYNTQGGMSGYTWAVSSGGVITAGQGTNTITVNWNSAGGQNISVNYSNAAGCSAIAPTIFPVTVFPLPVPAISGPSSCCVNSFSNNYSTLGGMTGYTWTVSSGGTISAGAGTSNIVVTWNSTGAQTVSVNYTDLNGCTAAAPTVFPVTVNSSPVPSITGATNLCANAGLTNYYTQTGMNNYSWQVSTGGTIVWGQGSATIQVSWTGSGAQWVSVNYMNASGCSGAAPAMLNVTVNPAPGNAGPVTGPSEVCAGAQGVAFSVAPISNALTYVWTLPPGAVLASGAGTNNITVNFQSNALSGNIWVYGNNICGNGNTSPAHPVTVSHLPPAAGPVTGKTLVCQGQNGLLYSVAAISGATGYDWTIPPGSVISGGANTRAVTVDYGMNAQSGFFKVSGTNACGNGPPSPPLFVTVASAIPKPVIGSIIDGPVLQGDTLFSSVPSGNQWFRDYVILPSDTNRFIIAKTPGEYFCIVTQGYCISDTSNHIWIGTTGIETNEYCSIHVYPVPSDGRITLSITCPGEENFGVIVYNRLGTSVFTIDNVKVIRKAEKQIDLSFLPNGIYTMLIKYLNKEVVRNIAILQ